MAFLEHFSKVDRELLVALPYRVGAWLSAVDGEGGEQSDYHEKKSLREIIYKKGRGMFESAFVHEVMSETCARESEWGAWSRRLSDVLKECQKARELIARDLEERDVEAYALAVMDVAVEVAVAYREFDATASTPQKFSANFSILIDKLIGLITREKYISDRLLNISYKEDLGLSKLAVALELQDEEKPAELT